MRDGADHAHQRERSGAAACALAWCVRGPARCLGWGGRFQRTLPYYLITLCVINNTHSLHTDVITRKNSKNEAGQSRRRQQHSGLWQVTANQYEGHDDLLRGEA